ncbi:targeting protein for Xklp2 isoform X1 [Peromyscus eremicus]|uniref:targeting protein for Xklp2 isoform X1 n=1 Tax=Peromyscus eremicus TaxID=42410 RepID=UPI0027DDA36D|nr:targeting protein for Xklp2 isoform X1 [Peromyscus eremicus]XP_059117629.1 targeting protein for Xklp2 isoform X1 [Peromyscus eremicus]
MSQVTTTYSFDAPTNFINFSSLDAEEDTENVDSWFEEKANLENNFLRKKGIGELFQGKASLRKAKPQQGRVTPLKAVDNTYYNETEKENLQKHSVPSNACSSVNAEGAVSGKTPVQPQRRSVRLSAQKDLEHKGKNHDLVEMKAKRCSTPASGFPPSKKMKLSHKKKAEEEEEGSVRGTSRKNERESPEKAKGGHTAPGVPPARQKILKSTEEQELEKRLKMQQEVVEMRRKNEEFKKLALAGPAQPVKKSTNQVTKTVDFHFLTDERIKQHPKNQEEYKEVNFMSELRKHPSSPARMTKGCTIVKPFNLSKGKKRTFDEATSQYVPIAQQVEAFHRRTPTRYHLRNKKDENLLPSRPVTKISRDPQTPILQTKYRARVVTCKSTAEQEAEEFEKLQQYKFKARELDPRIFGSGPILPKRPPVKPPTQPIGFDLEIEKRIQDRESKKKSEDEHFEFHSRPCPTKILEDVVGVPEKKVIPATVPKSPVFALRNRIRVSTREDEEEDKPVVIRAQPVPHYGVPYKPHIPEARNVEVCPFSFDTRDKERQVQKEKKIKEMQKGEVPKFKALPVPHFDTINLPEKKVKNVTQAEPFSLETDKRGAYKAEMWKQQLEEELKQQKEAACFKARPNTVVFQEPFVPKKEKKSVAENLSGSLVQEPFQLATEKRAKERQELGKRMAEMEAWKMQQLEEVRQQEEAQEKEELARLRKELVHKANPIRKYSAVEVKSSELPLTVPVSPKFSTRFQ